MACRALNPNLLDHTPLKNRWERFQNLSTCRMLRLYLDSSRDILSVPSSTVYNSQDMEAT